MFTALLNVFYHHLYPRHYESNQETPECSADLHEFKTSLILTTSYTLLIHVILIILSYQFWPQDIWKFGLVLQLTSCIIMPMLEALTSARVRYFMRDWLEEQRSDITDTETVIVT